VLLLEALLRGALELELEPEYELELELELGLKYEQVLCLTLSAENH
jgi:hypothetical protein